MQVSREALKEIADDLDSGFKCFIHKETAEVVSFPDNGRFPEMDYETWQDDIDKIDNDPEKYIEIENMSSQESFIVMEDFINSIKDTPLKNKLILAVQGRKPFANFKHQIENAGAFREKWFAFKEIKMIQWVEDQLSPFIH